MVNNANFPFVPGQGGRLATDRFDFQKHITGLAFRHTADQIDTLHPSLIYMNATTVEQALENLSVLPSLITASGAGYVSVPTDGYNSWHNANGSVNIDPTVGFLDAFLNPIFADITSPTPVLAGYARLRHGGVMFIPAGTYLVNNPINVPPGITLLGEGAGTRLINVSNLALPLTPGVVPAAGPIAITNASNTSPIQITIVSPAGPANLATGQTVIITGVGGNTAANNSPITSSNPYWTITKIDSTHFTLNGSTGSGAFTSGGSVYFNRPILNILSDTNRVAGGYADDVAVSGGTNPFMFARATNIVNLVLADNFVEPAILGDTNYKIPQNFTNATTTGPPLISQQQGSNLVLDGVIGIGRVQFASGIVVSSATTSLVYTTSPSLPAGAVLGTYLKINDCLIDGFSVPFYFAGLGGYLDHFTLTNSKVRAYGFFTGDSSIHNNNSFITSYDTNMIIDNNSFYGNASNVTSVAMIAAVAGSAPAADSQKKSKLSAGNNNIIIDPNSVGSNNNFSFFYLQPSIGNINNYINISGHAVTVNITPYTVNTVGSAGSSSGHMNNPLMVDTTIGPVQIILPSAANSGYTIIIKDFGGLASTNNITITPKTGDAIDGGTVSASYVYSTSNGSLTLISFSGNWWRV